MGADLMKLCTDTSLSIQLRIYWVKVSVAPLIKVRYDSLQNEIFKEVPNHDIICQMTGLPVSF